MSALLELEQIFQPRPQLREAARFSLTAHEVQEEYLVAEHPIVLCIAANRVGKTTGAIWDDIWRATGEHPYKQVPLIDCLWIGFPDYQFFTKVTERIFFEQCPRHLIVDYHKQEKHVKLRRVDGGICHVFFVSYEQRATGWAGAAVGYVHLDELPGEEHFREAAARVSTTGGSIGITVTPAMGLDWMEEELYLPGRTGEREDVLVLEAGLAEYDEALEKARPHTCGVGRVRLPATHPMGDRGKVEQFARSIKDPAERMIRIFGIYKKRTGGVYRDFDAEIHVVPAFKVPEHWEVSGGCDPGFNGFAVVVDATDPMGREWTVYEYFSQHNSHSTHVREIWEALYGLDDEKGKMLQAGVLPWLRSDPERYLTIYVDTANPQDVLELQERATEQHTRLIFAQLPQELKGREAGIKRVQAYLEPSGKRAQPKEVDRPQGYDKGEPRWYIFDTLYSEWTLPPKGSDSDEGQPMSGSRLVWELKNYRWKKPGPNDAHARDADENSAGGAHALAAKRYGSMARIAPPDEKKAPPDETPKARRAREHKEKLAQKRRKR